MGQIRFTVDDLFGISRTVEVQDDILLYDLFGKQTVDPTKLEVGDELRALPFCPATTISAKELI